MLKKVNLGCGPVGKDDWVNIDWGVLAFLHSLPLIENMLLRLKLFPGGYNLVWPKNLKLHDCRKRLPFNDNSVDYIYTSHFLEHFKRFEAVGIINESLRILKKGGWIRIAVPDLRLLAQKYIEKDIGYFAEISRLMMLDKQKENRLSEVILADILMDNFYPAFYKYRPNIIQKFMNIFVRPHLWMYDFDSLAYLVKNAGFSVIQKREFRRGMVPDLDCLDVFPEMTFYLEAQK